MRTGSCATTAPPRRRRQRRRSAGVEASSGEADAVLARSTAEEDDLAEVERDRAVLGLNVGPAVTLVQLLAEVHHLLVAHPDGHHLATREADLDAPGGHQCAGSTSSVRTPPVDFGWTKATRDSRMPTRGSLSII